jgi:hypothetical protein
MRLTGYIGLLIISVFCSCGSVSTDQNSKSTEKQNFNPIIPDNLADPSLVMFDDIFYMYANTDIDHGLKEMGPPVVWKSTDIWS